MSLQRSMSSSWTYKQTKQNKTKTSKKKKERKKGKQNKTKRASSPLFDVPMTFQLRQSYKNNVFFPFSFYHFLFQKSTISDAKNMNDGRVTEDLDFDEEDDFIKKQAAIQRQRKQILQTHCNKYTGRRKHTSTAFKNLIVDTNYKLVYCNVPKVACTNWKLVFEKLAGLVETDKNVTQRKINSKLREKLTYMNNYTNDSAQEAMNKSLVFIFVRHPFTRLLSAYRNKLDPSSTSLYKRRIGLGMLTSLYGKQNINNSNWVYNLTFSDFVTYISNRENARSHYRDIHWNQLFQHCSPCGVNYDFIGKLETIHNDVNYLFKLANLEGVVKFRGPEGSSPTFCGKTTTLYKYFDDVPVEIVKRLYKRYEVDFELFGYGWNPYSEGV